MNRYLIEGIAADVLDGKSVAYVVAHHHAIRDVRDGVAARLMGAGCEPKVKMVNGLDEVSLPNGGRVILRSTPGEMRGFSADVLVVDESAHHDHLSDLLPIVADGGELIRL